MKLSYLLSILFVVSFAPAQAVRVPFDKLTTLDELPRHLEVFRPSPIIPVKLPSIDTAGVKFIKIFCLWKKAKSNYLVIMILPNAKGEELYIDLNYNNDLSDDGPPHLFLATENEFQFNLTNNEDIHQKLRFTFIRIPKTQSFSKRIDYIDSLGNLSSRVTDNVRGRERYADFEGKIGTFYWDDRVLLRRGTIELQSSKFEIGLYDYSCNGLYNDSTDLIYIDRKQTGELNDDDPTSIFNITDIFLIGAKKFRLKEIDKYGNWAELESVQLNETFFYINQIDSTSSKGFVTGKIDTSWQQIIEQTLDGKTIDMKDYSGKYVLLNFWGEWCKPCIAEIPELKKVLKRIPSSKIQYISFLNYNNLEKAKKVIRDSTISWPQIILSKELEAKFRINVTGFPTNILIMPNGRDVTITGNVLNKFFEYNIH